MSTPIQSERPGFLTPTPVNQRSIAKLREEFPWSSIKKGDVALILDESELPTTPITRKAPVNVSVEPPPTFKELHRYLQNIEELPILEYTAEEVEEIEVWYKAFVEQVKPGFYLELLRNVEKRIATFKENLAKN